MATATPATAHADRWAVLALAIAARTATAVQFQSVGAMGPALLADSTLGIAYGGLGALIGAYMLPGIVLALPAGWMTARHGERRIALAGLALVASATWSSPWQAGWRQHSRAGRFPGLAPHC